MDTPVRVKPLCRLGDIPESGAIAVDALLRDGVDSVIVLRRDGQVHAWLNVCPHAGRRLDYAPGKFLLKHDTLTCAVHGATFKQTSGLCVGGPCCGDSLREIALRIDGDAVYLADGE
jgi:nitrite reductase/ring-hydroxylating ferredoxin subunit